MGRVLLIAGATGGLGSLASESEARNFSEVILLGRKKDALGKAAKRLEGIAGCKAHMAVADITDEKQLRSALLPFPAIDGLVNAAAVLGPVAQFGKEGWEEWKRAIGINLIGNASVCRAALPALLKSRRGKIVNFAGGGAAGVRLHHSAYAISKAAMVRFTEILAAEYPSIDANIIAPGAHRTGIWDNETHDEPPEKWADKSRFCSLVTFLLSEKSDGISGKFIHINDKWEEFIPAVSRSELYTLRRIEPKR